MRRILGHTLSVLAAAGNCCCTHLHCSQERIESPGAAGCRQGISNGGIRRCICCVDAARSSREESKDSEAYSGLHRVHAGGGAGGRAELEWNWSFAAFVWGARVW